MHLLGPSTLIWTTPVNLPYQIFHSSVPEQIMISKLTGCSNPPSNRKSKNWG